MSFLRICTHSKSFDRFGSLQIFLFFFVTFYFLLCVSYDHSVLLVVWEHMCVELCVACLKQLYFNCT